MTWSGVRFRGLRSNSNHLVNSCSCAVNTLVNLSLSTLTGTLMSENEHPRVLNSHSVVLLARFQSMCVQGWAKQYSRLLLGLEVWGEAGTILISHHWDHFSSSFCPCYLKLFIFLRTDVDVLLPLKSKSQPNLGLNSLSFSLLIEDAPGFNHGTSNAYSAQMFHGVTWLRDSITQYVCIYLCEPAQFAFLHTLHLESAIVLKTTTSPDLQKCKLWGSWTSFWRLKTFCFEMYYDWKL